MKSIPIPSLGIDSIPISVLKNQFQILKMEGIQNLPTTQFIQQKSNRLFQMILLMMAISSPETFQFTIGIFLIFVKNQTDCKLPKQFSSREARN